VFSDDEDERSSSGVFGLLLLHQCQKGWLSHAMGEVVEAGGGLRLRVQKEDAEVVWVVMLNQLREHTERAGGAGADEVPQKRSPPVRERESETTLLCASHPRAKVRALSAL
jgi:hypothetical protein